MSEAYEQILVALKDVPKTAFATIFGTFVSRVMQQGDCNAPSTFQRTMTLILRDFIGRFIHVYLDNIFIYSYSIEEHEEHLRQVFLKLREAAMYLSPSKADIYSEKMDCLGHVIDNCGIHVDVDNRGIHVDVDKMRKIRKWRRPRSFVEVQRF